MSLPRKKQEEAEDEPATTRDLTAEQQNVLTWREDVLQRAGLTYHAAAVIARRTDADLHRIEGMKARGCSDELLLRITSPLPRGGSRRG